MQMKVTFSTISCVTAINNAKNMRHGHWWFTNSCLSQLNNAIQYIIKSVSEYNNDYSKPVGHIRIKSGIVKN